MSVTGEHPRQILVQWFTPTLTARDITKKYDGWDSNTKLKWKRDSVYSIPDLQLNRLHFGGMASPCTRRFRAPEDYHSTRALPKTTFAVVLRKSVDGPEMRGTLVAQLRSKEVVDEAMGVALQVVDEGLVDTMATVVARDQIRW